VEAADGRLFRWFDEQILFGVDDREHPTGSGDGDDHGVDNHSNNPALTVNVKNAFHALNVHTHYRSIDGAGELNERPEK
jgi:hypothetical protein